MSLDERVDRLRSQRLVFLRAVYDRTQGRTNVGIRQTEISCELGFDDELSDTVAQYLVDEGLLAWSTMGHLAITHAGIVEIEDGLKSPAAPTRHFPSVVIAGSYVQVGSMHGSAIQQGAVGSTQSVSTTTGLDVPAARAALGELRAALSTIVLDADERAEVGAELSTIDAQLASPKPKSSILRESAQSVRNILEGTIAGGVAPQLPGLIEQLVRLLSAAI